MAAYLEFNSNSRTLFCNGNWILTNSEKIYRELNKTTIQFKEVNIDGQHLDKLDSAGAWLLLRFVQRKLGNLKVNFLHFSPNHIKLLELVKNKAGSAKKIKQAKRLNWLQDLGKISINNTYELYLYINFIGVLFFSGLKEIINPTLLRWNTIINTINKAGFDALPIIALLSCSIGIVISYQMGNQLREYGANIFIVNLLGLSVLREFGPLLTAIMVGGRTGSSFTAQLGIMKINQEIDAIQTMGISPIHLLVMPRLYGLFIVVPLLTIWADIFGIIGGMIMAQYMLNISWQDFLIRFQEVIPLRSLIIGLAKAPVFALIIACTGCYEGMSVQKSAEIVGERTTRSVVIAIFLVILFDGLCSVLLSKYKL